MKPLTCFPRSLFSLLSVAALFLVVSICLLPMGLKADTLFDGGNPDRGLALRISDVGPFVPVSADDFATGNPWLLTEVLFWTDEVDSMFAWDGSITYFLFKDEAGLPATSPSHIGSGKTIVKQVDETVNTYNSGYRYTFALSDPLELDAGQAYWLGINLGGGNTLDTTQAFWAATSSRTLNNAVLGFSLPEDWSFPWSEYYFSLAFQLFGFEGEAVAVPVDVLPGECPSVARTKPRGPVRVAIVGTDDFDVRSVDVASISIEGVRPLRSKYKDVATPFYPLLGKAAPDDCTAASADGIEDLVLKFDRRELVGLIPAGESGEFGILDLTAKLSSELDDVPIRGQDVVVLSN